MLTKNINSKSKQKRYRLVKLNFLDITMFNIMKNHNIDINATDTQRGVPVKKT